MVFGTNAIEPHATPSAQPLLATLPPRGLNDRRSRGPIQQLIEQHAQQLPTCRTLAQAPEPKPDLAMCRNG